MFLVILGLLISLMFPINLGIIIALGDVCSTMFFLSYTYRQCTTGNVGVFSVFSHFDLELSLYIYNIF